MNKQDNAERTKIGRSGLERLLTSTDVLFGRHKVVARILEALERYTGIPSAPLCLLDPSRVRRTAAMEEDGEIVVRYQTRTFVAVRGGRQLSAAVDTGEIMTPMVLAGEGSKPVH